MPGDITVRDDPLPTWDSSLLRQCPWSSASSHDKVGYGTWSLLWSSMQTELVHRDRWMSILTVLMDPIRKQQWLSHCHSISVPSFLTPTSKSGTKFWDFFFCCTFFFKCTISVVLNSNYHHNSFHNISVTFKKTLDQIAVTSNFPPNLFHPHTATNLLSVSRDSPAPNISYTVDS